MYRSDNAETAGLLIYQVPDPLRADVMVEVRRFHRYTRRNPNRVPSARMRRRRKALGERIVQWRKEHTQTVHTGRTAPALLINAQQEISDLEAKVVQLEAEKAQLESDMAFPEEELASIREYKEEMEVESTGSEESDGTFNGLSSERLADVGADELE